MKILYALFISSIFTCFYSSTNAQVLTLGNGSFTGSNFAGPANTSTAASAASRYAYIFPESTVSSLRHGDTIRSISFLRNGGSSLGGNCNMKIFMRMMSNSNYGAGNINWVNRSQATGMKKVYDQDPKSDIGSANTWVRFTFNTPFVVDTILGKNLELLVEYVQSSAQSDNIFWSYESSGTVNGYGSNQAKFSRINGGTLADTTNFSSEVHPSIRIEFPRTNFDVMVNKVYSLGKLPIPLGNPDTVRAIIQNVSKNSSTIKLYIESKGSNNLKDSATYNLGYLEERTVNLPLLYPSNTGLDSIYVTMEKDSNVSNNQAMSYRLATDYTYSYKDPTRPIAGGVGFNGTTGDFVAKFYSSTQKAINQVSLNISGSNQKFKIGIWAADGKNGTPGTNVWTSDTLLPAANFITPVIPPVNVNGNFYVGVRQIGTVNVGFGYQPDVPVRKNTFYYASPLGDTTWVDFAPDAPFKFTIEPRIQTANDVAAIKFDFPKDTVWLNATTQMAPKATFYNYGSLDQTTAFPVKLNIFRYGNLEFTSTRNITLNSGQQSKVTFDSSFYPQTAGVYDVHVITRLSSDQVKDNDTLRTRVVVAAFKDVGPATIFDPSSGYDYEQFVDTIFPTVFVQNYGLDNQGPFGMRAEIYDSAKNLIYSDNKSITLTALNSVLASFKPFPCDVKGTYYFRAFTQLGIDVDKTNDTVFRTFKIVRSNDVSITSVIYPENGKSYAPPVAAKKPSAVLENVGDANQGSVFPSYCDIYFGSTLVYSDSFFINSFRGSPETLLFKNFTPSSKGYYTMKVYCSLPGDQNKKNDTMTSVFAVGVPDDIELVSISPAPGSNLQVGVKYPTSFTLRNNGYNAQLTPFPVIFKVTQGASLKYVKVKMVTLDSAETKTFAIDTSLMLDNTDSFNVSVYSSLNKDFIKTNDTIAGVYYPKKDNDIGVDKILYPTFLDTLLTNTQNVQPVVSVRNFGDSLFKERFKVVIKISNAANGVVFYNKSIDTVMNLAGHLFVQFPMFSINNSLNIKVLSYTEALTDQMRINDTSRETSRFLIKYDPSAVNIQIPVASQTYVKTNGTINPKVSVKNNGIAEMPKFSGIVVIKYQDTVLKQEVEVYRDSVKVSNLAAGASQVLDFIKGFNVPAQATGDYKCYYDVYSIDDQVFTNNKQVISFKIDNTIGIESFNKLSFLIYPNPTAHVLNIDYVGLKYPLDATIVDVGGREVKKITIAEQHTAVDVSDLSEGVYFIKVGNGLIKFVVE